MAALSIEAVSNYGTRYHTQRINRRLDDRDNVLKEALEQIEEKDHAIYPTVEAVDFNSSSATQAAAALAGAGSSTILVCTCSGTNFSTTAADYDIRLGGVAIAVANQTATSFEVSADANVKNGASNWAAGDKLLCQVRISDVLCTEFFVTVA